jgi:hypothetical protein
MSTQNQQNPDQQTENKGEKTLDQDTKAAIRKGVKEDMPGNKGQGQEKTETDAHP